MPSSAVSKIIGDTRAFTSRYWTRQPYHHKSADSEFVQNLLTLDEVDEILARPSTRPPYVEIKRDGQVVRERIWTGESGSRSLTVHDAPHPEALAAQFGKSATLILNHLDEFHDGIRTLCDAFQHEFRAPTKAVVFITPPAQPGLGLHYDTFEGFIVQTHGTKRWFLYDREATLTRRSKGLRREEVREPITEVVLQPGDCLYIPWGTPHHAVSEETVSVHVTLMCDVPSWDDILTPLLRDAIPDVTKDRVPVLGQARPNQLVAELQSYLAEMIETLDAADIEGEVQASISRQLPTSAARAGFLEQEVRSERITPTTRVSRNRSVAYSLEVRGEKIAIGVLGRRMEMPAAARSTVLALADSWEETVESIASPLTIEAKMNVVRHLVRSGLLRLH